jgi:hypothetical protein
MSARGAVLDAATLIITTVRAGPENERVGHGAAQMMHHLGCHAVADLSIYFRFRLPPIERRKRSRLRHLSHPGVEIYEFRHARRSLEKAGYVLKDEEESWQDFSKKRAIHAHDLNNLAKLFAAVPAPWIGDRTTLPHLQPHAHQNAESPQEAKAVQIDFLPSSAYFAAHNDQIHPLLKESEERADCRRSVSVPCWGVVGGVLIQLHLSSRTELI